MRNYNSMRALIQNAGSRFAQVTFIKKDGSERTMLVQPATGKYHVRGDEKSESRKQAQVTYKANNPHLMPCWDVDRQAFRTINLDTVVRIAANKEVHEYGDLR